MKEEYGYQPPSDQITQIQSTVQGFVAPSTFDSTVIDTADLDDNSVRTNMRMGGSMDEFNEKGGQEEFIKKLAESLGIDPSQI